VKVSSSGKVSAPATLAAGTYKAKGTDRDSLGDTGIWSFTLKLTADKITQLAPASATTAAGEGFTGQLEVSGSRGTVTFTQSNGAPSVKISSSGKVSTPATLAAGTYKATGSDSDTHGDTGIWSFALTVTANKITQVAPATATIKAGKAFTGQLEVSGSHGAVTYAQSSGAPHLKVSSSGKVSAPATLAAGIYKAKGTDRDSLGNTGTWSFTLKLTANKITQLAPTSATITAGKAFTDQLKVSGSRGTVTFTQSSGAQILTVSASGTVLAPEIFAAGIYKVTGTVRDSFGDIGTWSFTLTVDAAASALDLQAAMDLQRHNKPAGDVPSRTSEVWRAVSDVGLGSPDRSQRRR
jgi:major membrane immunogen (membrane-anchored lipoprotein)